MKEELNFRPKQEQKPSEHEKNIQEVFKMHPELEKVGDEQAYAKYLETIFPESKIKDILWHSTNNKFDRFKKEYIGSSTDEGSYGEGFYFERKQQAAFGKLTMPTVLNLKNPITSHPTRFYEEKNNKPDFSDIEAFENYEGNYVYPTPKLITSLLIENGFDGVAFQLEKEMDLSSPVEYVAFEPEQVHILGSKSDLEGFKEFVAREQK